MTWNLNHNVLRSIPGHIGTFNYYVGQLETRNRKWKQSNLDVHVNYGKTLD